jgi:hypothetical protein
VALTVVQTSDTPHNTGTGPAGTITATFASPTAAGNTLVACIVANGTTANPVATAVTLGGAAGHWRQVVANNPLVQSDAQIWFDPDCDGGQTSVTVTFGTGGSGTVDTFVTVYEVAGAVVPDQRVTNNFSAGGTWTSTATAATARADEIFFGTMITGSSTAPVATGAGTWTTQGSTGGPKWQLSGYQIVAVTGTATFSGTQAASASAGSAAVATFAPPAASPAPPLPPGTFAPLSRAFGPNPPFWVQPPQAPPVAPAVTPGPPVYPLGHPVQARQPLGRGGTVTSRDGTFAQAGPPVRPPRGPVRAQPAVPFLKGRTSSRAGTYAGIGPRVRPPDGPVQAARPPVSQRSGRATGRGGTYAGTGPPLRPPDGPVRVLPTLPPRGRAQGRTGTFTSLAPTAGPPVYPLGHPVQARRLPQRGGSVNRRSGVYAQAGPALRPPDGPVRAQPAPTRGGRTASRAGTLTAGAPQAGPPVYPLGHPVRTRPQPPPRGRIVKTAGTYAGTGPPVRPAQGPVGVSRRQPPPPTRGRTASQRGPYGQTGPPVIRARKPVRGQPARPVLTGRAAWRAGTYTAPFVAPFTVGVLTASTAPGATLTASGDPAGVMTASAATGALTASTAAAGADSYPDIYYSDIYPPAPAATLTATDQRTGGPGS